jgi:uncharacterized membrane protein
MATFDHLLKTGVSPRGVRAITGDDVSAALRAGWADFGRVPAYSLVFGIFYALVGGALVWVALASDHDLAVFPLMSAFFLVGPITAVGLYEISRRLGAGEPLSLAAVAGAFGRNAFQIAFFGAMLVFVGLAWMKVAYFIYAIFFGSAALELSELISAALTTPRGLQFLAIGNVIGIVLATVVFSMSVIAVPMLLDRDVDAVTAALTSIEAVKASPLAFAGYAALIVFFIGLGLATFMVGLVVTLPLIGHATWHLYKRAVAM